MTARALAAILITLLTTPLFARGEKHEARETPAATVLCYHIVESPQDPRMEVSRETFRQQMRYLSMTGYNVIPLRHLYEYVTGTRATIPANAVVITIDDGWRSTYTEVFPEMQKRKFPFTVFIYPKIIGQTAYALTWKQVREMADAGVDIQSHSLSHPFLTQRRHSSFDMHQYAAWLEHELAESKQMLERETGHPVTFLAYPYGDYDHHVTASAARAGYDAALTCDFGRVRRGSDPLRMKRFVIDKKMDFAAFRHYLGAGSMSIQDVTPLPNQVLEPEQPVIVSAKIPNYKSLDPKSIGMALLTSGVSEPFSYDARDGSITMVLRDALETLQGKYQRAVVWARESRTGRRVEAVWTFRIADPNVTPPAVNGVIPSAPPIPGSPAMDAVPATAAPAQPRQSETLGGGGRSLAAMTAAASPAIVDAKDSRSRIVRPPK